MTAGLITNILGGVAVGLLALVGRGFLGMRNDFRKFMGEHAWLIITTAWNRDKVKDIMTQLGMPIDKQPPDDLPWKKNGGKR